ncbi:hypothetical protein GS966_25595 [Rhodococcus hoagii]|nr:hypothetical protein [Prescottella equi]NKZ93277.1 hypothetical protein [Prescottella equi]
MTSTQTAAPTLVDPVDRAAVVEQAQREYAAEHGIELTEDEFALAKAGELVRIERLGLPATETRLVKAAQAGVRYVANKSHRRRPLSVFDLVAVWVWPLLGAAMTGASMWTIRDLRESVSTAQYPSWLPSEVTDAMPRNMDWFWGTTGSLGGLLTVIAVLAAASATWWTQTYRNAALVAKVAVVMGAFVLMALLAAATMWAVGMTHLAGAGGGQ